LIYFPLYDYPILTYCRGKKFSYGGFCLSTSPGTITAKRILIKPNLGYPVPPPVTVNLPVLSQVLRD
jgi:hypothetical protein